MAYIVAQSKEESRYQISLLVEAFARNHASFTHLGYSEAQLRIDFINHLLKSFGWDVDNESGKTQFLRDVIQEEPIEVEENAVLTKKNPDYTLRTEGIRKLFVEAKKASIDIEQHIPSCFQTRRYGWSANLAISILTNFNKLIVYDCRYKPESGDQPHVGRYRVFSYEELLSRFDELYELLSLESVSKGAIEVYFSLAQVNLSTFDEYFLHQIERWRLHLASNIIEKHPHFSNDSINFLVQRLLNRIVFLRICEDREIEVYETLKGVTSYEQLKRIFQASDAKYNSGLFDFIDDNFSLNLDLDPEALLIIFKELYYPESPYDFSVVDPAILSQIYERYLGSRIVLGNEGSIEIVEEPEVAASSGVVPTPKALVRLIVQQTLDPLTQGKTVEQIAIMKFADICCGSGTFLIALFDYLVEIITLAFVKKGNLDPKLISQDSNGSFRLSLKAKQNILLNNIYGVDINPYAVEVSKFSLSLKLLEFENGVTVNEFAFEHRLKVLPQLDGNIKTGNSLVDNNYFKYNSQAITNDVLLYKVKPFSWQDEFQFLKNTGGFDAILGNPPYVRIQNMTRYLSEEIKYYQHPVSGYTVAQTDTFDKYYLFIQRAVSLVKAPGTVGYIVPHKFFIVKGGKSLRDYITSNSNISKIIHFGVNQMFPGRSTYTAVLVLSSSPSEQIMFKRLNTISQASYLSTRYLSYNRSEYGQQPWIFLSDISQRVFTQMEASGTVPLSQIAEIAVGLQTSADRIYIFKPIGETENTYKFIKEGLEVEIEKSICKPCLYDLSFSVFDTVDGNAQMIFPYQIVDGAEPFSEDEMKDYFPLAWEYLNRYRTPLSKRSINGSREPKWYQFGRSQSLTRFHDAPKLIWPVLSTKPSYIYDTLNLQFTGGGNGPYYSLFSKGEYSPLYILGILVHPLMEARIKSRASEFRGEYYSHGKQFIESLPIKAIDFDSPADVVIHQTIVEFVKQLIETRVSIQNASQPDRRQVLNRKYAYLQDALIEEVNKLYGVTNDDITKVLNDPNLITEIEEA